MFSLDSCSQDPRRDDNFQGKLQLSSPFGLHDLSYRGSNMVFKLIKSLFSIKPCLIYLTDYNKLYLQQMGSKANQGLRNRIDMVNHIVVL
jgi:hypothetical protein